MVGETIGRNIAGGVASAAAAKTVSTTTPTQPATLADIPIELEFGLDDEFSGTGATEPQDLPTTRLLAAYDMIRMKQDINVARQLDIVDLKEGQGTFLWNALDTERIANTGLTGNIIGHLQHTAGLKTAPDKKWIENSLPDLIKSDREIIPPSWHDWLFQSTNSTEYEAKKKRILAFKEIQERLEIADSRSWWSRIDGTMKNFLIHGLDPATWIVSGATIGGATLPLVASGAFKQFSSGAARTLGAAIWGVGAVTPEMVRHRVGVPVSWTEAAWIFGIGAGLGTTFSALARMPHVRAENRAFLSSINRSLTNAVKTAQGRVFKDATPIKITDDAGAEFFDPAQMEITTRIGMGDEAPVRQYLEGLSPEQRKLVAEYQGLPSSTSTDDIIANAKKVVQGEAVDGFVGNERSIVAAIRRGEEEEITAWLNSLTPAQRKRLAGVQQFGKAETTEDIIAAAKERNAGRYAAARDTTTEGEVKPEVTPAQEPPSTFLNEADQAIKELDAEVRVAVDPTPQVDVTQVTDSALAALQRTFGQIPEELRTAINNAGVRTVEDAAELAERLGYRDTFNQLWDQFQEVIALRARDPADLLEQARQAADPAFITLRRLEKPKKFRNADAEKAYIAEFEGPLKGSKYRVQNLPPFMKDGKLTSRGGLQVWFYGGRRKGGEVLAKGLKNVEEAEALIKKDFASKASRQNKAVLKSFEEGAVSTPARPRAPERRIQFETDQGPGEAIISKSGDQYALEVEVNGQQILAEVNTQQGIREALSELAEEFDLVRQIQDAAELAEEAAEATARNGTYDAGQGSVGAAKNPHFATLQNDEFMPLDPAWTGVDDTFVGRKAKPGLGNQFLGWILKNTSPTFRSSIMRKNPVTAYFAKTLINDTVGPIDRSSFNTFSGMLDREQIWKSFDIDFETSMQPLRWAYWQRAQKANSSVSKPEVAATFNDQVGKAWKELRVNMRNEPFTENGNWAPEIVAGAKHMDRLYKKWADFANDPHFDRVGFTQPGRPLPNADNWDSAVRYHTRAWDEMQWAFEASGRNGGIGLEGMEMLLEGAILSSRPALNPRIAKKMAKGMVKNITNRTYALQADFEIMMGDRNIEELQRMMRDVWGLSQKEIDEAMEHLYPARATQFNTPSGYKVKEQPGATANLKRKVIMDENFHMDFQMPDGSYKTVHLHDLLVKDAEQLFKRYNNTMSGRLALARIRMPKPGVNRRILQKEGTALSRDDFSDQMLVDGITTDGEWETFVNKPIRNWYAQNAETESAIKLKAQADIGNLEYIRDRILGRPHGMSGEPLSLWLSNIRAFNAMRLMGQAGFAQLGETAHPVAHLGLRAAYHHFPGMRSIRSIYRDARTFDSLGRDVIDSDLFRAIESIGIAGERMHSMQLYNVDLRGEHAFDLILNNNAPWARAANKALTYGEHIVYEASGMSFIQQQQQRMVAGMMMSRFATLGYKMKQGIKLKGHEKNFLRFFDLDETNIREIFAELEPNVTVSDSVFFGPTTKIHRLNFDKWTNLEAKVKFKQAVFRGANKFIQVNDPSMLLRNIWGNEVNGYHPVLRTILQFRTFVLAAYENQLLYNLNMSAAGDPKAMAAFVWTTMWNATVVGLQRAMKASAMDRTNREKYWEKHITPFQLAKAGFERSGWSSILPMALDTSITQMGGDAIFDARTTGNPQHGFFQNPTASWGGDMAKGLRWAWDLRAPTKGEASSLARATLPFNSVLGIQQGLNLMFQGLPDKAPRKQ